MLRLETIMQDTSIIGSSFMNSNTNTGKTYYLSEDECQQFGAITKKCADSGFQCSLTEDEVDFLDKIFTEKCTNNENAVLRRRFGLIGEKMQSLEEIAQELGVTRERIRIIEQKAIRRFYHHPLRSAKRIADFYS